MAELPLVGLGKPLGFADKEAMGPQFAHKTILSHKHTNFQEASTTFLLTHRDPARDNQGTTTTKAGSTLGSSDGYQHGRIDRSATSRCNRK
jgi:hypothetical protein